MKLTYIRHFLNDCLRTAFYSNLGSQANLHDRPFFKEFLMKPCHPPWWQPLNFPPSHIIITTSLQPLGALRSQELPPPPPLQILAPLDISHEKKSRKKVFDYLAGCFHPEICRLMWEIFDRVSLAYRTLFSEDGTLGVREQKGLPTHSSQYV